ncbi:MAG TPA: hypothetical protein VK431_06810 [Nitrosopumilaceae archaeon]|nr:hypothetical protein [Nitrosopumilaceae archaeon]
MLVRCVLPSLYTENDNSRCAWDAVGHKTTGSLNLGKNEIVGGWVSGLGCELLR